MGVLLMLMTIGGFVVAAIMFVIALYTGKAWLAKFAVGSVLAWLGFYALLLFGSSYFSTEKTLSVGEPKEFCGFYLDCHLHAEVTSVRQAKSIGTMDADGTFYIVGVRVFSNARNPAIAFRLITPSAVVKDTAGKFYARNEVAESLLPTSNIDLGGDIRGREVIEKEIVFDLPNTVSNPRLDIREGYGIDHAIEAALIGDEDSLFHKRNYFDLTQQNRPSGVQ